jgi:nucleotide-binding universal stress UspA family protein
VSEAETAPSGSSQEAIVVGYIPTPLGVAAFVRAKDEAVIRGARVVVVNTGSHGNYSSPLFAKPADLEAIDAELTNAGIAHEVLQPTEGRSAADEILDAAARTDATLIILGLRRRSPVGKLLLGSTAQQVLLEAPCAVLAVKGDES